MTDAVRVGGAFPCPYCGSESRVVDTEGYRTLCRGHIEGFVIRHRRCSSPKHPDCLDWRCTTTEQIAPVSPAGVLKALDAAAECLARAEASVEGVRRTLAGGKPPE